MSKRLLQVSALLGSVVVLAAACSASSGARTFSGTSGGQGGGTSGTGDGSTTSSGTVPSGGGGQVNFTVASTTGTGMGTTSGGSSCVVTDPNVDMDKDGWTPAQGDCNDCDPNVNPGAVDVPGDPNKVDSDCDGKYDPPAPCDSALQLADVDGVDGAKAIELCQTTSATPATPQERTWGVISSSYVHANGGAFPSPDVQVGIENGWGTNVHPQGGSNMLVISSGHARTPNQPDACGSNSCAENAFTTPPVGFPQDNPNCPPSSDINDDIALQIQLRVPTNATGYSFKFKFYSFEYPTWVCNSYNDQFVALAIPAPTGSLNGNISFDADHNPVSVNLGFFDVCDPSQKSLYASNCINGFGSTCPTPPNPYCPSGTKDLLGTGFDIWDPDTNGTAGATSWLTSQAPVQGGSILTLRFAMWDTGDQNYDSTTLIDDFQWIATKGTVTVGTTPVQMPQ